MSRAGRRLTQPPGGSSLLPVLEPPPPHRTVLIILQPPEGWLDVTDSWLSAVQNLAKHGLHLGGSGTRLVRPNPSFPFFFVSSDFTLAIQGTLNSRQWQASSADSRHTRARTHTWSPSRSPIPSPTLSWRRIQTRSQRQAPDPKCQTRSHPVTLSHAQLRPVTPAHTQSRLFTPSHAG